jgi:hypothetical protein
MQRPVDRRQFLCGAGLSMFHLATLSCPSLSMSCSVDTLDKVIAKMEQIIDWSIAHEDRRGYFIALYYNMTLAIREGILNGQFADAKRMERLAVRFFARYLDAFEQYAAGELPSRVWLHTFESTRLDDYIVLQHMAGGVNAHINLDLGVATARVAPGDKLPDLFADYYKIDEIIAPTYLLIDERLGTISPGYRHLTGAASGLAFWLVNFSIQTARRAAWRMAEDIAHLEPTDQLPVMLERDRHTTRLGKEILRRGRLVDAIWRAESKDVADNISVLAFGPG